GTTTVTCTASDSRNNTGTATFHVTVSPPADTTPPVITVPADITAEATGAGGAAVTYTASAADGTTLATFPSTPASGSTFPLGATTVNCTATDSSNNTSTKSFTVTVVDTTPPAFSNVPADITTSNPVVSYTDPTATDLVDGARTVSCTPASGSTFA